jgi:hypothetical protein
VNKYERVLFKQQIKEMIFLVLIKKTNLAYRTIRIKRCKLENLDYFATPDLEYCSSQCGYFLGISCMLCVELVA